MEKEKVSDVEKLFYRPESKKGAIEGYLGNPEDCEILFVLKEANTGGYETLSKEFWMKRVIGPDDVELSDAYINVLGTIAIRFLNPDQGEKSEFTKAYLKEAL